jgi:hypothetical protein
MKNNYLLLFCISLAIGLTSCESTTKPDESKATFTDSTLFILSEGSFGGNNTQLDGYSLRTDSLQSNIINPLGDIGNDIQIFGKRLYVLVENSNKILSVNPDSIADRFTISFPNGSTPYNMTQVSSTEVWVSGFTSKQIYVMNPESNTLGTPIPTDNSLSFISAYKGKAYMLTNANTFEVMDIASKNILNNKYICEYPAQIIIDSARNSLIVLAYGDAFTAKTPGKIFWIDPNSYQITDSITIEATDYTNQIIAAGNRAYLPFGNRLDMLDLSTHKISSFIDSAYYKGIYDASTNRLILGKGGFSSPGAVDIIDASSGIVKKSFASGILPGHFVIYRK